MDEAQEDERRPINFPNVNHDNGFEEWFRDFCGFPLVNEVDFAFRLALRQAYIGGSRERTILFRNYNRR